ncbi:tRNA pseudouridine(55) synthase TruB [soil metagenome]
MARSMTKPEAHSEGVSEAHSEGVLPLDKPAGPSSHDMVAVVRRALHTRRIGHTGTLDPFASGLMLLCIGTATRTAEYLSGLDKRYHARVRLGVATDTDDCTGNVIGEAEAGHVTRTQVEHALEPMLGDVLQIPPVYSAKKRGGERAYAAARAGRPVELDPVPVRIHELVVLSFDTPFIELEIACGSGTYIRAIARDLGAALGTGAHLTALRRTAVGRHTVERALKAEELADPGSVQRALIPTLQALAHLPRFQLTPEQRESIEHGRSLRCDTAPEAPVILLADGDSLVAIAEGTGGELRPRKVFL